jgi:hypothetical protein
MGSNDAIDDLGSILYLRMISNNTLLKDGTYADIDTSPQYGFF